jgi:ATP-dependent Clp protease adaptor protein ClpS
MKKFLNLHKIPCMGRNQEQYKESTENETEVLDTYDTSCSLIVWNDEVNTFEWVIATLVEICQHTEEQAEQCAMIIHTQGKYAVKQGSYDELKPMCDAITDRGIGATIEVLAD